MHNTMGSKTVARHLAKHCYNYRKPFNCSKKLIRLACATYKDGIKVPVDDRPNPRKISNYVMAQKHSVPNTKHASNMFWLWGQFTDHNITIAHKGKKELPILIPKGDHYFDPKCTGTQYIPFNRSEYCQENGKPINQINDLTPLLDGAAVYSNSEERLKYLRTFNYGLLKMSEGNLLPFNDTTQENDGAGDKSLFVAGDIRCNEHIGLVSIHTIFAREHNYWANKIKKVKPCLCDEEIFQKARMIVEAEIQAITFNEFLPLLLGECMPKYKGYNKCIDPRLTNEFAAAAYRLGHALVPSYIGEYSLRDIFFSSYQVSNNGGIDNILKEFYKTPCEELNAKVTDHLRNFLFGDPGEGGLDLASLNIQRGRDHGLGDLNKTKKAIGQCKIKSFDNFTNGCALKKVYCCVNCIDLWVGGLSEKPKGKSMLGPTLHYIIKEQFLRIRDGDSYWYERQLDKALIKYINRTRLSDIIKRNTNLCRVPKNVFKVSY